MVIQGTKTSPKYPDTDDPLIIGVVGAGFSVVGLWVGSGTGQLRSALAHDRPVVPVFLWVWGFPFWWN